QCFTSPTGVWERILASFLNLLTGREMVRLRARHPSSTIMNPTFSVGRSPVRIFRQAGPALAICVVAPPARQLALAAGGDSRQVPQPRVAGDGWQIAGDPDLGELTATNQQPVDFGIWQAADGAWQLWSCIRKTKEPGNTRLLYRWESAKLTDRDWRPRGIALRADPRFGEKLGGLQAPFVFRDTTRFVMFYGGWEDICSASSTDGKRFERQLNAQGKVTLFGEGSGNTRDPMVIRIGDVWHCYYTAHPQNTGADYCRTSPDLRTWSAARVVARGGRA